MIKYILKKTSKTISEEFMIEMDLIKMDFTEKDLIEMDLTEKGSMKKVIIETKK